MRMSEYVLDIVTDRGIPFRVIYGKRQYRNGKWSDVVVSFYDRRNAGDFHGENGQFVSDYRADTLLVDNVGYGLALNGDYAEWTIDKATMDLVRNWLVHHMIAGF